MYAGVKQNMKNEGGVSKMVMTYDGALVMPSSYAVMNEEEMTYVEGGIKIATWVGTAVIDAAVTVAFGGAATTAVGWLLGKGVGAVTNALVSGTSVWAGLLKNALGNGMASFLTSKLGMVGTVISFTSVGGTIMNLWDMCDNGKIDGYVNL